MDITWTHNELATVLHAALSLAEGRAVVKPQALAALRPALLKISELPVPVSGDRLAVLDSCRTLAATGGVGHAALARQALTRRHGSAAATPQRVGQLAAALQEMETAWRRERRQQNAAEPAEELSLRLGPLRSAWEARGPGLLRGIGRWATPELLAERATVVLVLPAVGGDGAALAKTNTVLLEAVLANPHEELPEIVRLAWLLAQLNLDLPHFADTLPPGEGPALGRLALLPPTLAAAAEVELVDPSPATLVHALVAWHLAGEDEAARLAGVLARWWETYVNHPVDWRAAMLALGEMRR